MSEAAFIGLGGDLDASIRHKLLFSMSGLDKTS